MTFNSLEYIVLLVTAYLLFWGLPWGGRMVLLLAASVVFYAWWNVPYVGLVVLSAGIDYLAGLGMRRYDANKRVRLALLISSLTANLAILGYFKYANFFIDTFAAASGHPDSARHLAILLPPGISFYTFQSMSYTIDVYRRTILPTRSPLKFYLFVLFFPQLVAGPIERAGHLIAQFDHALTNRFSAENLLSGARLIVWGLFKKVMLADYCGLLVAQYYTAPHEFNGAAALVATYAFSVQIYFDFSAYSDIARGSARLFGVDLIVNFDQPLIATSVVDFWRRWHISLYSWFRDYVYLSLGGNRYGLLRTLLNVAIVMSLSGLWHGAAWRYVLWGLYHGFFMVLTVGLLQSSIFRRILSVFGNARGFLGWFIQFHLCVAGYVIFCSSSLANSAYTYRSIWAALERGLPLTPWQGVFLAGIAVFLIMSCLERRYHLFDRIHQTPALATLFYGTLIAVMVLYGNTNEQPFFYFQF